MTPIRLLLTGCNGHMGKVIAQLCEEHSDCIVVGGIDRDITPCTFPVFGNPEHVDVDFDVAVDFSHPSLFDGMLAMCTARRKGLVMATTGLSLEQLERLDGAAMVIPVFRSANMSVGINLMQLLIAKAATALPGFDIEIIERHHNRKVDAPSGTALMLADSLNEVLEVPCQYVYDRHSIHQKRSQQEIGIHSVRGGTIVGTHEVLFAGPEEMLTITHEATSREVFASGAIRAAVYLASQPAGMYDMKDLLAKAMQ